MNRNVREIYTGNILLPTKDFNKDKIENHLYLLLN